MSRKTAQPQPDSRREVTGPHTCVHESNWKAAREAVERQGEIIRLLLTLEPALDKYRKNGDWGRRWDVEGMKAALEFKRLQEAHDRYATPVVSETSTTENKE